MWLRVVLVLIVGVVSAMSTLRTTGVGDHRSIRPGANRVDDTGPVGYPAAVRVTKRPRGSTPP